MRVSFDELAIDKRRVILVASDTKYDEIINQTDWIKVIALAGGPVAFFVVGGPLALAVALFGKVATTSAYLATTFTAMNQLAKRNAEDRSWWQRLTTKGEIPLPHLPPQPPHQ